MNTFNIYVYTQKFVYELKPLKEDCFVKLLSAVQERRVWQCGAVLSCETQTQPMTSSQNDGLSMPNCVSS